MRRADDDGSVLLLTLGYALLALALIFVSVCATDLDISQRRLDAIADAAALAGADGFTLAVDDGTARADLTDQGVRDQAEALLAALPAAVTLESASSPDGQSSRVRVAIVWKPPLVAPFVPEGIRLESTGTSRTALR
ncbi:hypothetical protein ACIP5T_14685 [Microbacterium sp. NPDC088619]|uniref:hypothetical protein n=1 Tax=Microbacterium sp. NPDC088619 TaxID=3364196 RepID=UPI003814BCD4